MKANSVTESLSFIYLEKVLSQFVSFVVTIVLARILMPSEYGIVAIIMVFLNIADVFVTAGMGNALIQKKKIDDGDYSTILSFSVILSIILYVLLLITSPYVAQYYKMPLLAPLLKITALKLPLAAIMSVQQAYISRNMLFHKQLVATLIGSICSAVLGIFMAIKGFGAWALVSQYLCNSVISLITLQLLISYRFHIGFEIARFTRLFSFGWKLLASSLIDRLYSEVRSLVIGKMFTPADLAFYTKGQFFPNLLMSNIDSSMTRVLFPVISKQQDDLQQVRNIISSTVAVSSYLIIPLLVCFSFVADKLILIVLTEKWLPCVPYLQIFCVYYMFTPMKSAKYQAISAIGRSDVLLKCEIVQKFFGIIILLYTIFVCGTVKAIALGNIAFTLITVVITTVICKKYIGLSYRDQLRDITHALITSGFVLVVLYLFSWISISIYIDILIQVVAFSLTFIAASKAFHFKEYEKLERLFLVFFDKISTIKKGNIQ